MLKKAISTGRSVVAGVPGAKRVYKFFSERHLRKTGRIVLGADITSYPGWAATNRWTLDLLNRNDFARLWRPGTREAFLAEHVFEHLTVEQAEIALRNCFEFLKPGGWLRIAVPDGFHPDPQYIEWVRPLGIGPGSDDHKVLYDEGSLSALLEKTSFSPVKLEYWDSKGIFHKHDWNVEDGFVKRSFKNDDRNIDGVARYTSLIVDAVKPHDGVA